MLTRCSIQTVGCRSEKGLTVLLVPRQEGVETRPVKTAYSSAAGTAYITFKDVKVPIDHLLGKEHDGLRVIRAWISLRSNSRSRLMSAWLTSVANFNVSFRSAGTTTRLKLNINLAQHERWMIICGNAGATRIAVEETLK